MGSSPARLASPGPLGQPTRTARPENPPVPIAKACRDARRFAPCRLVDLRRLALRPAARADEGGKASGKDAFAAQVKPLLAKYCFDCHSGSEPKGDLKLDELPGNVADAQAGKTWLAVAQRLRDAEMPPEDEPQLTAAEARRLLGWIDRELAGAERKAPREPGRVTLRRLNRVEYTNTIRDLLGLDFHGADDFPSDDVGYGFDNIGDVLSLPPLLLEKYLAAAQTIAGRTIVTRSAA